MFLLVALSLSLLAARPAQAQFANGEQFPGGTLQADPCDASGVLLDPHPYPDRDGFFPMSGTQTVTITHTYSAEMVDAGLAAWPNGYQTDWLQPVYPIQMTAPNDQPGLDPTALHNGLGYYAGISSPHEVDAGNSFGPYGSWWYTLYDASGASHIGPVNGSVMADVTGRLVSYYKVTWYPSSSTNPAPMPDHLNLLLKTNIMAEAAVYPRSSLNNNGLWAQATASDGSPFGETASASAGLAGDGTLVGSSGVVGYHLVRAAVDPATHIATVYLDGTMHYTANNAVPYGTLPDGTPQGGQITNGGTYAHAASGISAGVKNDNREVAISSNFDNPTTYYLDPVHHHQIQNVRQPDGSMAADITVPSILGTPATYSPIISGNWGSNSTYSWQSSLPNSSHQTLSETGIFNSTDLLGNQTIPGVAGIYYDPPASDKNSDTITLTLKDGVDGATASNTYTVRFHSPYPINFQQDGPGTDTGGGVLRFRYTWQSSTGNLADLTKIVMGETVTWDDNPGSYSPYTYTPVSPPYSGSHNNPTEVSYNNIATIGSWQDQHRPVGFSATMPQVAGDYSYKGIQTYWYLDSSDSIKKTLAGPYTILKHVWSVSGPAGPDGKPTLKWYYQVTKAGSRANLSLN